MMANNLSACSSPWVLISLGAHTFLRLMSQKDPVKRFVFSAFVLTAAIVATGSESRGDGSAPTVAQVSARTKFMSGLTEDMKTFKEKCGTEMKVTTDFQNYDLAAMVAAAKAARSDMTKEDEILQAVSQRCGQAISSVARFCTKAKAASAGDRDRPHGSSQKPQPPPVDVKEVQCLFAGHSPRQREPFNDYVLRNMSYSNGVFVLRNDPRMGNIEENILPTLRPSKMTDEGRKNGAPCTTRGQCQSFACVSGTCRGCGPGVSCDTGASCSSEGICTADRDPGDSRGSSGSSSGSSPSKPEPSKPSPKENGETCAHDSDCASKICGTISSPGGNHKCGTKR